MGWFQNGGAQATGDPMFEKAAYQSPASSPTKMASGNFPSQKSRPAPRAGSPSPGGSSLFDRYGANDGGGPKALNSQTHTSRLRAQGVKLVCYVNTEVNRGRSSIIHLPEAEDTIEEVLPYIQRQMKLDKRMKYAQKLFTPDGTQVSTFDQLANFANAEIPIIVACGEPFDTTTIPVAMVSFQEHGGGRAAAAQVKHELAERRKKASQLKADQVRAAGHGTNSVAAKSARMAAVEDNRNQAAAMRHEFMENLLLRAAKQEELVRNVRANNEVRKAERDARNARGAQMRAEKYGEVGRAKNHSTHRIYEKQQQMAEANQEKAAKAALIREQKQQAAEFAKAQLAAKRKEEGDARRVSHIKRSVNKADSDESALKSRQNKAMALRSP